MERTQTMSKGSILESMHHDISMLFTKNVKQFIKSMNMQKSNKSDLKKIIKKLKLLSDSYKKFFLAQLRINNSFPNDVKNTIEELRTNLSRTLSSVPTLTLLQNVLSNSSLDQNSSSKNEYLKIYHLRFTMHLLVQVWILNILEVFRTYQQFNTHTQKRQIPENMHHLLENINSFLVNNDDKNNLKSIFHKLIDYLKNQIKNNAGFDTVEVNNSVNSKFNTWSLYDIDNDHCFLNTFQKLVDLIDLFIFILEKNRYNFDVVDKRMDSIIGIISKNASFYDKLQKKSDYLMY